ncbi:hypothetical protein FKM82_013053 [Ascaphus truei]
MKIRSGTSCCSTDNCTPSIPTLPADNSTKNGVTCPGCFIANSDDCSTTETMECTGDEKKCILQTHKISGSEPITVALRGCATESLCNIGSHSVSSGDIATEVNTKCSN